MARSLRDKRKASRRLVYLAAFILISVLVATNTAVIAHFHESEMRDQEGQLRSLSLTLAEQADRTFQAVDLVLTGLDNRLTKMFGVDSPAKYAMLNDPATHQLLEEKLTGMSQLDAITMVSSEGKLVNSSRGWPLPDIDLSDRDYFKWLRDKPAIKNFVSAPVLNRGSGTWTIFLAHRVNGSHGESIGLILGAIQLSYFEDFYRAIEPPDGGAVILLRQDDGVILARYPPNNTTGKSFNGQQVLDGKIAGTLRATNPTNGEVTLKAAHAVNNYPILVMAVQSRDSALEMWREISGLMALGTFVCIVAVAFSGFAVARHLTQQAILAGTQSELLLQTERALAFDAMKTAKEAAESADRTKSEFLAQMSHELRTPLNAIIGFSDMMCSEIFGPLSEQYREYTKDIHDSGCHLLMVINDVLDLSKAASGKAQLMEQPVDAKAIVASAARVMQPLIHKAGLRFEVRVPPEAVVIRADERLMKQMLLNLLSNAAKFTPANGTINCTLAVDQSGIKFVVSDTGIGIMAENLDKVMMPFAQVDSGLNRKHEGSGLGLPLVKVMTELHGGVLCLDSTVGVGTTASIVLPKCRLEAMPIAVVERQRQDHQVGLDNNRPRTRRGSRSA